MKSSINKSLHISYHDVNQGKPFRSLFRRRYFLLMKMIFCNSVQRWENVYSNILPSFQMKRQKVANCLFEDNVNCPNNNKTSTFGASFHSDKNRLFAFCPAASLADTLTADKSIIKFNQFLKPTDTITMGHCNTDLFQYIASSQPRHPYMFGQSQDGDSSFIRSGQVNYPKPLYKWYFCCVKQCVGSYRYLMSTMGALVKHSCRNETGFLRSASRTLKTLWPTDLCQRFDTCSSVPNFFCHSKREITGISMVRPLCP